MIDPVFVELHGAQIIRIFRSQSDAVRSDAWENRHVEEFPRKEAVKAIRRYVFARDKGTCKNCGEILTWATGHMHEKVFKSQGGEVSVDNCIMLCYPCHEGRVDSEHPRIPRFGEKSSG